MPFGIKEIAIPETIKPNPYQAAVKLIDFEKELYSDSSKNNRKRKRNGNLTESDENLNVEKSNSSENQNESAPIGTNKKRPRLNDGDVSEKKNDKLLNAKTVKPNDKVKLSAKKKSKKLSISDPLSNKKLKKSKKSNKTVTDEIKTASADDASTGEHSTCCNWNVDVLSTPTSASTSSAKVLEKKKTSTESQVLSEKKVDSNLLKPDIPWLTPVLTRLEEQNNKVSES